MSLLKAIKAQLGLSVTPANNFVLDASADNGTIKLARGNAGATTQDILTVDADGRINQGLLPACVMVNTANGYGSTNTVIRRFTNVVLNQGNDITYADSATLGASFTINKSGVYAVSYNDDFTAASNMGISLNSSQLTTAIYSINIADILSQATNGGANWPAVTTATVYIAAGGVVRAHATGHATGTIPATFSITRVA